MRSIALFIMIIPGVIAAYGIILMRDAFFGQVAAIFFNNVFLQFIGGLILFVGGLGFIGGFIVYRDKKRGKRS
ncbi:DUF2627 family protein [Alkalibacillus almallahensis]|uniref:DUF2627 family protein n=1 Tax=Alkalibacillus almallahensis TaxID=1379154 RepID=UPI0014212B38|nr:DUF2627 family protein [Alkalibacillus almallahensis]NIK12395.1 hypothetical protein [Alkalibacillus almallahensis]